MPQLSAPKKNPKSLPAFPLRVAAVDVGSNAMRFIAAEFRGATEYDTLAEQRMPVRLGHDVFLTGKLPREAMDAAVEAMKGFRRQMETLGIEHYRAVATSAMRESRNGGELVQRIRDEAGLELEVITGSEEARLVYADPSEVVDADGVAARLAPLLDKPAAELSPLLLKEKPDGEKSRYAVLARAVDPDLARRITGLGLPGIGAVPTTRRVYPNGALASSASSTARAPDAAASSTPTTRCCGAAPASWSPSRSAAG